MRSIYKRQAWLVNDGVVIEGYTAKRKFYPNSNDSGFEMKEFKKKDIGKTIFYKVEEANNKVN